MAGIGIRLRKIYKRNTIGSYLYGFLYSAVTTIAPMFVVIIAIVLIQYVNGFSQANYADRELFSDTVLYIFIFSLLTTAPFNGVLSRYLSDTIYEERYSDIMPCYYVGLLINVVFSSFFGIAFCVHEYLFGEVPLYYVLTGYCGYMAMVLVFYSMLYLTATKDYRKISMFYAIGMVVAFVLSRIEVIFLHWEITYSLLFSLAAGFFMIASMETAMIHSYYRENSGRYDAVLHYFRIYWKLIPINFLYTLGLYAHNFVFWTMPGHLVFADSFVTNLSYDMATCFAMFTNITATAIFMSRLEMNFHDRYKAFSESIIGGRRRDIENNRKRMLSCLSSELVTLARMQFIISVVVFLLCIVILPTLGFGGEIMRIYHCLAAGYYIMFMMYAEMLYLFYFNDLNGALMTASVFCGVTFLGSLWSARLEDIWYGMGLVLGSLAGFIVGYFRLRWVEKHLDEHIFCDGRLMERAKGVKPDTCVWRRTPKNETV